MCLQVICRDKKDALANLYACFIGAVHCNVGVHLRKCQKSLLFSQNKLADEPIDVRTWNDWQLCKCLESTQLNCHPRKPRFPSFLSQ